MAFFLFLLPFNLFASSFTVATYNVQNLFDNEVGLRKIHNIKKVIKKMKYPEFLGLQEIENEKILSSIKNYQIVMSKIKDKRGMGVALLYKKGKKIKVREIPIENSRSILEVEMKVDGIKITFFIVHWPSQRNPHIKRIEAAEILLERIKRISYFIILGDFNLDDRFELNPLFKYEEIVDLNTGEGTYFYIPFRRWGVFDRIVISKSLFKRLRNYEYEVFKPDFISTRFYFNDKLIEIPWKFNKNLKGYSDHFPVRLKIDQLL
ncbi:MAG: hypothetical protein DRQ88_10880 [Epsilonproteobacteria bacterium]|nr:MAG: hypothetical protein DRQ89_07945 [Campylobacterota bacterium]RLA64499.1 MAG: hypothetical protein DRQ88_10880 [Campylobacterota bacterium]